MKPSSTLIAVLDTSYSGGMFDLAHAWNTNGNSISKDTPSHVFLLSSSQEDEYLTRTGPIYPRVFKYPKNASHLAFLDRDDYVAIT